MTAARPVVLVAADAPHPVAAMRGPQEDECDGLSGVHERRPGCRRTVITGQTGPAAMAQAINRPGRVPDEKGD